MLSKPRSASSKALLDMLGVEFSPLLEDRPPRKTIKVWGENQVAVSIFLKVATHGQWLRAGMDAVAIGLDGRYLISYLQLTHEAQRIPPLLDDIHLIADGYLSVVNAK